MNRAIPFGAVLIVLSACDASTGPGNGGNVAIKFGTASGSHVSTNVLSPGDPRIASDLTVTGTNGTLVIDDIRFIVEEIELESSESSSVCNDEDDNEDEDDECEFEGGPFIVDLPLDGSGTTTISTANLPAGTFDSFKFKIDDFEADDEDDDDDAANAPNLLADIRTVYPNFPSRASMVVHGTQNGTPFTVYFRSKIKIEDSISPPLVVPGDPGLTVMIDPSMWFKNGDQVLNLAALNGRLVDLGNFRNGIIRIHHDDDDD